MSLKEETKKSLPKINHNTNKLTVYETLFNGGACVEDQQVGLWLLKDKKMNPIAWIDEARKEPDDITKPLPPPCKLIESLEEFLDGQGRLLVHLPIETWIEMSKETARTFVRKAKRIHYNLHAKHYNLHTKIEQLPPPDSNYDLSCIEIRITLAIRINPIIERETYQVRCYRIRPIERENPFLMTLLPIPGSNMKSITAHWSQQVEQLYEWKRYYPSKA